jgi:hypothetical protein
LALRTYGHALPQGGARRTNLRQREGGGAGDGGVPYLSFFGVVGGAHALHAYAGDGVRFPPLYSHNAKNQGAPWEHTHKSDVSK